MTRHVLLGIGSNLDPHRHIVACLDALQERFGPLEISRVFESPAVGLESPDHFHNLVVAFESAAPVGDLRAWCKALELAQGRLANSSTSGSHTLDIDLLCVGELTGNIDGVVLPRGDIERYAFVLKPLAELLPEACHPQNGLTYAALWAAFDATEQPLWPIDFRWRERRISWPD
ncbi:2-amino-4-hydroxy-6-hydroxymethyldihydropteridine diphosphokinase [Pistricoccus aurantiacus]|uniref:2-amino-4-hydroxy-6-hydroxymethyldihydropteridine diphosphokinase n=1 Tax=Pistricoccus aurantiacus TaxID=1883414 RepID=A0A5B8SWF7_9GAMM|nr:2-amino-4-hydroxy-6-hydroxymethyldihydropteridine diphosphokinase [Pistricoccus aurantiacus]QEA39108.1 2-amino-4-hydroxy-6-hydroxymethyldihydropteridine diphosphokinase [Pistricoccus aurantiacus]